MASELERQLRRLRDDLGAGASSKKVPSILFHPKEAERMGTERIYDIGLNGLVELEQTKEPRLRRFRDTLFSQASSRTERALLSDPENRELDESINNVLRLIAPYMLQKPAQKIFEYLIRRFEIHIRNVDEIFATIMPYHDTNLFGRVVGCLVFSNTSMWGFLRKLQKFCFKNATRGGKMNRETLANQCVKEPELLNFVCERVREACANSPNGGIGCRLYASFQIALVSHVLDFTNGGKDERIVRIVMSYVIRGVRSSNPIPYQNASRVLLLRLASRGLSEEHANRSIVEIASNAETTSVSDATMCVVAIASAVSSSSIENSMEPVSKMPEIASRLSLAADRFDISALLKSLVPYLASKMCEDENMFKTLKSLIQEAKLSAGLETQLSSLVRLVIEHIVTYVRERKRLTKTQRKRIETTIRDLNERFPEQIEQSVCVLLSSQSDDDVVTKLIRDTLCKDVSERHIFRVVTLKDRNVVTLRDAIHESSDVETRLSALENIASLVKENGAAVMPSYISKSVAEILSSDKTHYETLQIATCRDIDSKMLSSLVGNHAIQRFAIKTLSSASSRLLMMKDNARDGDIELVRVALSLLPQPETTWKDGDSEDALASFLSILLIQNEDLKREFQECTKRCAKANFVSSSIDSVDMLSDDTIDSDVVVRIMAMPRCTASLFKFMIQAVSSEKSNLTTFVCIFFFVCVLRYCQYHKHRA